MWFQDISPRKICFAYQFDVWYRKSDFLQVAETGKAAHPIFNLRILMNQSEFCMDTQSSHTLQVQSFRNALACSLTFHKDRESLLRRLSHELQKKLLCWVWLYCLYH